jgi:peptidoglycan/xylan/chitin deacetylase (PgdA/CDA1 family)
MVFLNARRKQPWGLVVAMHETPRAFEQQLREQLEWVSRYYTISDLNTFAGLFEDPDSKPTSKPPILFTFDDGRESNYQVAAPLLESFGGRGVFFIVPAFAECPPDQALAFYRSRINPGFKADREGQEDWKPMTPDLIADLARRGHAIGNHTLTHARLAGLSHDELEREIGEGARKLSLWTNQPVEAFAWTFGWDSIDADALEVIRRRHRFCFSPCAGAINFRGDVPGLLWRREVEVKYSPAEFHFLYSGLVDPWWSTRRTCLKKMLRSLSNMQTSAERRK